MPRPIEQRVPRAGRTRGRASAWLLALALHAVLIGVSAAIAWGPDVLARARDETTDVVHLELRPARRAETAVLAQTQALDTRPDPHAVPPDPEPTLPVAPEFAFEQAEIEPSASEEEAGAAVLAVLPYAARPVRGPGRSKTGERAAEDPAVAGVAGAAPAGGSDMLTGGGARTSGSAQATPVQPPRKLSGEKPAYPYAARLRDETGRVSCRIHVDDQGRVLRVELVTSSGSERLDAAALRALERWTFAPATCAGRAVAGSVEHTVHFVLEPR